MKRALGLSSATGIRSEDEKKRLTEAWFQLALACAKTSVRHEAALYRQRRSQQVVQNPRTPPAPGQSPESTGSDNADLMKASTAQNRQPTEVTTLGRLSM